jgi:outer membrane protein assembly factor BamB
VRKLAAAALLTAVAGLTAGFSWLPLGHEVRPPAKGYQAARPWYIADAEPLVDAHVLDFNPSETASPVLDIAQTRLYVALRDGRVFCRFRGAKAWTWRAEGGVLATPLLDEATDTLYVATAGGAVVALNRITGAERWRTELKEELTTPPTLSEGKLFLMSSDESVVAVDVATGKSLWKFHRDRPGGFTLRGNSRPVVAHGLVYAGFADGYIAALRIADGVAKWVRNPPGSGDYLDIDQIAAPEGDARIYAASAKGGVFKLDALTGETEKQVDLPGANHVVVDGPRVYATGKGVVVAFLRRDLTELWRAKLPKERFATQPVATTGMLLLAEDRGSLISLDPITGIARAVLDPGTGFSQPVTAVEGAAFILSNSGTLFSLGLLP